MSFENKVVIVTGAGGGIGEGYAKRFAEEGMCVVIAELDEIKGNAVAADIVAQGGKAIAVKTDVADDASCAACAAAAVEAFGGIDYLVNNAAIFDGMRREGYLDVDLDYLELFMRVNAHGCLLMTRAVVPFMEQRGGGAIVNQSSIAAWMNMGFYGVAKLTMNGITCSLAKELGPRNIRINAIASGPTDTPALRNTLGDYADQMVQSIPMGRLGTPGDMAESVLFLLSDKAAWITGLIMNVDGGHQMRV